MAFTPEQIKQFLGPDNEKASEDLIKVLNNVKWLIAMMIAAQILYTES